MLRVGVGSRLLRLAFVAYVIATAVHIGYVVLHEPFAFDAWNVAQDTGGQPITFGRFLDYGVFEYTHANPRLGQWFAYLAYKLEYFAAFATPLAYLGTALAVFVIGTARWPSWQRGRDLALYAMILGFAWFAIPRIGMLMFCRAYSTNYVYGALIQLWFLVPLRLRPSGEGGVKLSVPYFFLGLAAGMSNEHTGPTLVVFALGYAVWKQRETGIRPNVAWTGAFGAVIGFAAIFFAPGQGERYDGLATKVGLASRLLQRGFSANLDIVRELVLGAAPIFVLLAIVLVIGRTDTDEHGNRQRAMGFLGLALGAVALIAVTMFVSPKLGPRFFMHSCFLLLAAFIGVADTVLVTPKRLVGFVLLALTASTYAAFRTIPTYLRVERQSEARVAALVASARGSVFTAEAYEQVEDSWWFLGDDFRFPPKRDLITQYFDLKGVILRGTDLDAPLGVSGVKLVPHYAITPRTCLDEHGGLELGEYRGTDVGAIQKAMRAAIDELRAKLAGRGTMDRLALEVEFAGERPTLPRPTLLVGRWREKAGFEGWAGALPRAGVSLRRKVVLPEDLKTQDLEVVIYKVGHEFRSLGRTKDAGDHEYEQWGPGVYWGLACRPDECFVIAAIRQL